MSVVVEADDVDWRKRKPKDGGEMGRPRVRKKSEGFIRESGSSFSDIAAWAKKWHDEDAPKTMMNYGSVVTKESIARSKKPVRKGPSLLGVLAAQPHQTRDARSRFNDPKRVKPRHQPRSRAHGRSLCNAALSNRLGARRRCRLLHQLVVA